MAQIPVGCRFGLNSFVVGFQVEDYTASMASVALPSWDLAALFCIQEHWLVPGLKQRTICDTCIRALWIK